jgi:hypothetical protein
LEHHFTEATRAARRNLLLVAVIAYLLIKGKWVPDKIDVLGLNFGALQHRTLLQVLIALLAYYLLKFYLYLFTDGEVHRHKANQALVDAAATESWKQYRMKVMDKQRIALQELGGWGLALFAARFVVDYLLPVAAGGYALLLVSDALKLP